MNPLQRMEAHKDSFTQNEMLIYKTISQNPSRIVHMTTSTLAEECGVSQPTLSRFIKGLGYNRYQDFRVALITWQATQEDLGAQGTDHLAYFNDLYQTIQQGEQLLTDEFLTETAAYIDGFDRVFLTGTGKSFQPAQLFEILIRKGRRIFHAVSRDLLIEMADVMGENDLLIVFSVSAGAHIMQDACRTNGKVLLVTANSMHAYGNQVDRTIVLPYLTPDPETSSLSPVMFDILVELLVRYLMREDQA
ncbi:MAG: MurR/RpiR family transcriptional regulator [Clostridiales bacterium]|nr:MurR/RpiR family transcriptional regulator [Clostridiales bacterium]